MNYIYNEEKKREWIDRFEDQKELIKENLLPSEEIKQCLDTESFNGRYYNPIWVVTSEARIWSLDKCGWYGQHTTKQGRPNAKGEYIQVQRYHAKNAWEETVKRAGTKDQVQVYYHQIVANYFCDKTAIKLFGEDGCVPHHLFGYYKFTSDDSICCRWINRAKHLCYVRKYDHKFLSALQNGTLETLKQKKKCEYDINDPFMRMLIDNGKFEAGNRKLMNAVLVTYGNDGIAKFEVKCPIIGKDNIPYL